MTAIAGDSGTAATRQRTGTQGERLYGGGQAGRRVTVRDLAAAKARGEELVAAGIPVMGHLGLTPQSVNAFGGYRVQGRGEDGEALLRDAKSLQAAGAFAVVLECVPATLASQVTASLAIPVIGIGAGAG